MDYAAQVKMLYKQHKTWRGVAKKCGFSPAYWMRVSKSELFPSEKAISSLTREVTLCYQRILQRRRKNVSFSIGLYKRMLAVKNAHSETWQQFGENALKARLRMEEE